MHCHWVLKNLPGERVLSKFWVRLRTMGEDGGEVPACGCAPDEETLGEVRVEAPGVLLGLVVPVSDTVYMQLRYIRLPISVPCTNRSGPSGMETPERA